LFLGEGETRNGGFAMTEAHCQNHPSGKNTAPEAPEECHTVCGPVADQELKTQAAGAASAMPAHLSLLRDALAGDSDRHARTCAGTCGHCGRALPSGRRPFRSAVTRPITLSQWVSRTATPVS